jgi:hypothetical protein
VANPKTALGLARTKANIKSAATLSNSAAFLKQCKTIVLLLYKVFYFKISLVLRKRPHNHAKSTLTFCDLHFVSLPAVICAMRIITQKTNDTPTFQTLVLSVLFSDLRPTF